MYLNSSPEISPTNQKTVSGFGNHRKALAVLGAEDSTIPSISRNPPSAATPNNPIAPWVSSGPPSTTFPNNFFNESSEHLGQLSPSFRPGTGRTAASDSPDLGYEGNERRPSVASATTISSQGSKSSNSGRFHKKLQGFFGEDYPGSESKQASDSSLPAQTQNAGSRDQSKHRDRNNSVNASTPSMAEKPSSPSTSRPRTPLPSSDVTPWMYQDFNVSIQPTWDLFAFVCKAIILHISKLHFLANLSTLFLSMTSDEDYSFTEYLRSVS